MIIVYSWSYYHCCLHVTLCMPETHYWPPTTTKLICLVCTGGTRLLLFVFSEAKTNRSSIWATRCCLLSYHYNEKKDEF